MDRNRASMLIVFTLVASLVVGGERASGVPARGAAVTEETAITDPIDVPAEGHQFGADLTLAGDNGVAVWIDARKDISRVWAARLEDGGVSKTVGWEVPGIEGSASSPTVAASEDHYLIAWNEWLEYEPSQVKVALLDRSGNVVRSPISLGESAFSTEVAVAGLDDSFVVAFENSDGALVSRRVDARGVAGRARVVFDESPFIHSVDLAAGEDGYLLTFVACDEDDCRFGARAARITSEGEVLDPDGLPLHPDPPSNGQIRSAWNGTTWVALWPSGGRLLATHVAPDERPGSRSASAILTAPQYRFDLAWTGANYVIAMTEVGRVSTSTLLPSPLVATPPVAVSQRSDMTSFLSIDSGDGETILLWDAQNGARRDVFEVSLLPTGQRDSEPTILVQSAYGQIHPSVAAGTGQSLALWQDYRAHSGPIVYGARIDATGRAMDPQGFRISEQAGRHPIASWNGEVWLVVWKGSVGAQGLVGKRVGPDGSVLDPVPIPIAVGPSRYTDFEIDSSGDGWVVIYRDAFSDGVKAVHISAAGIPSQPVMLDRQGESPALAWHGDRYVAVWERLGRIKGVFLSEEAQQLDAARRIAPGYVQSAPSVASDGTSALIAWADCTDGCDSVETHGLVMQSSFDDGAPRQLSSGIGSDGAPIAFHDGIGFGVVFKRCMRECLRPSGYLRYVDAAGAPDGAEVYLATAHLKGAPAFSLAASGDGAVTVVYRKVEGPASAAGVPRGYKVTARRL